MISARLSTRLGPSTLAIVFAFGAFTPAATAKGLPSEWLGQKPPGAAYPEGEEDRQFAILSHDLKQRARFKQFAPQTLREESLILDGDRDPLDVILRRSEALLADLTRMARGTDPAKPPAWQARPRNWPLCGPRPSGPAWTTAGGAGRFSTKSAVCAAGSPSPIRCWISVTS